MLRREELDHRLANLVAYEEATFPSQMHRSTYRFCSQFLKISIVLQNHVVYWLSKEFASSTSIFETISLMCRPD